MFNYIAEKFNWMMWKLYFLFSFASINKRKKNISFNKNAKINKKSKMSISKKRAITNYLKKK